MQRRRRLCRHGRRLPSDDLVIRECDGTRRARSRRARAPSATTHPCTTGDVRRGDGTCAGTPYTCDVTACLSPRSGRQGRLHPDREAGRHVVRRRSEQVHAARSLPGRRVCPRSQPGGLREARLLHGGVQCHDRQLRLPADVGRLCGVTGCFSTGTCSNGVCSGVPRNCSSFDGACTVGICDARTGGCAAEHKSNGSSCDPGGMCVTGAVCAFGICELAPATCPPPTGPCKVPACQPSSGACYEMNLLPGTTCDPKTSCMTAGLCNAQGFCLGSPAPNGESCTLPSGAIGLCVTGSCVTTDAPDAGVVPDAGGWRCLAHTAGGRGLRLRRRACARRRHGCGRAAARAGRGGMAATPGAPNRSRRASVGHDRLDAYATALRPPRNRHGAGPRRDLPLLGQLVDNGHGRRRWQRQRRQWRQRWQWRIDRRIRGGRRRQRHGR